MDSYCKKIVDDIYLKYDKDRLNQLERKSVKNYFKD